MGRQSIPLKKEFGAHQILALCYHFYNKNMYVDEIDSYYSPPHMIFKPVDALFNSSLRRTEFDLVLNKNFTFSFDNYKQIYDNSYASYNNFSKTRFILKYNDIHFDNWTKCTERYCDNRMQQAYLKKSYEFKDNDGILVQDELQKYHKAQEETVRKVKFYEEECLDIVETLSNTRYKSYTRKQPLTFDFMYGLRKYSNCINSYMKKGVHNRSVINDIYKSFKEDMQMRKIYNFKALKFTKVADDILNININKSFEITFYNNSLKNAMENNIDSVFNVVIPVFEEIGGYDELQNVILHNRILTE